jgi:cytochrome c oxidase subunit 4
MATTHVADAHVEDDPDAHPNREKQYVIIALILAGLTVVEVLTYTSPQLFGGHEGKALVPILLLLMAVKFWMVVGFFMHLRFDKRILTVAFYSGLFLALAVFVAILTAMRFWGTPADHVVQPPGIPVPPK